MKYSPNMTRTVAVIVMTTAVCALPAQQPNMLRNGNFTGAWHPNSGSLDSATAEGKLPDSWEDVSTWSGASTRYRRIDGPEGAESALRMEMTSAAKPGSRIQLRSAFPLTMKSGTCYRASFRLRNPVTDSRASGRPGEFLDDLLAAGPAGRLLAEVAIRQHQPPRIVFWTTWVPVTPEWRTFKFEVVPSESGEARFFVTFRKPGILDIADMSLVETGKAAEAKEVVPAQITEVRCVPTRGKLIRHSDICTQYSDSPANLAKYLVDFVTWGGGTRIDEKRLARTRSHIEDAFEAGVRLHAINCTLVQAGGRCIVSSGKRLPDTYKRFYDLRKDNEGQIRHLEEIGVDLTHNSVLDVNGDWVPVPWLRKRWRIPMASIYSEKVRDWYFEMADAAGSTGANALHFDEPALGAYGLLNPDPGDFSATAVRSFREWLKKKPEETWKRAGIKSLEHFDYREFVLEHGGDPKQAPLWREFVRFQLSTVSNFVRTLRDRIREKAGEEIPFSTNADPTVWIKLPFIELMDFMSSEVSHEAKGLRVPSGPALTYRLGDAFGQPVVTMAHGGEWYLMKKDQRPILVSTWIALGYAFGHHFIMPHRAWVMDPEKGSQTYRPVSDHYACMARFIKAIAPLLDGYAPISTVGVVAGCDALEHDKGSLKRTAARLCDANIPFHMAIEGNDLLRKRVSSEDLEGASAILIASPPFLRLESAARIEQLAGKRPVIPYAGGRLPASLPRPVRLTGSKGIWVLPRMKPGPASSSPVTLHLLNRNYNSNTRSMERKGPFAIHLDRGLFPERTFSKATIHQPRPYPTLPENDEQCHRSEEIRVTQTEGSVEITVPSLDIWGVIELE